MNNLVFVIGPAPSEDPEAFAKRLSVERLRVGEVLKEIRDFVPASKVAGSRKRKDPYDISPSQALEVMKEMGIESVDQLVARIKEIKARGTTDGKNN